ncbi:MAG: hypothetical protein AAGF84_12370 [Planctomycetota bacterium]
MATESSNGMIVAPPFPLGRSLGVVLAVLLVGEAVAFAVLLAMGDDALTRHGWSAVWLGLGGAAGSGLAFVAIERAAAATRRPGALPGGQGLVTASLAGFFIRAVVAGLGALVAIAGFGAERVVAGGWLIGWYAIFLVIDVTILRRFFRLLGPAPGNAPGKGPGDPIPPGSSESSDAV